MWKTNIIGKEQIWYTEEEYGELVDKFNKTMYNIEKALNNKDEKEIKREVESWKRSMSVKSVE